MDGETELRCRLIIQGFRDPDVASLVGQGKTQSPTLNSNGRSTVLQLVASCKFPLVIGDIKGAFLEADEGDPYDRPSGPLYVTAPRGHTPEGFHPEQVYRVVNGYGGCDQPQRWWLTFQRVAREIGFVQHPLDPCLFMLFEPLRDDQPPPTVPLSTSDSGSQKGAPGALCGLFGIHVDDTCGGGRGAL